MDHELLQEIERFLSETDMGETYFGLKAARNPHLVARLREGRRVWPDTAARVRAFIASHGDATAAVQGGLPE